MSTVIEVSGSIRPATVNTPLDERSRVQTVADILNIKNPELGGRVFVVENAKWYKITALKAGMVGPVEVDDTKVKTYEEVPDAAAITGLSNRIGTLETAAGDQEEFNADVAANLGELQEKSEAQDNFNAGVTAKHEQYDGKITEYNGKFTDQDEFNADVAGHLESLQDDVEQQAVFNTEVTEELTALKEGVEAKMPPAMFTLPIPQDKDNNTLSFIFDVCENGFFDEEDTTHILMNDHLLKMELFSNGEFAGVPESGIGNPYYGDSISFTMDTDMFPDYVPGKTYYARYRWMDQATGRTDWWGFKFNHGMIDLRPVRTTFGDNSSVPDEESVDGEFTVDYLNGDVQRFILSNDAVLRKENILNIPFKQAIQVIINPNGHTLTLVNGASSIDYTTKCLVGVVDIGEFIMVDNEIF